MRNGKKKYVFCNYKSKHQSHYVLAIVFIGIFVQTTPDGVKRTITFRSGITVNVEPTGLPLNISKAIFVEYHTLGKIIQKNQERKFG